MMNITIAIDDVNPLKDWRILGDKTEKYLFELNKKYGVNWISKSNGWYEKIKKNNIEKYGKEI